jgi:SAM-dependent methyltransferase
MSFPISAPAESHANDHFVARYVATSEHHLPKLQTFASSTEVFKGFEGITKVFGCLPKNVSCLFQGYTAPYNIKALENFLCHFGIKLKDTLAIDLLDIPSIYKRLGIHIPELRFIQGNACDLRNYAQTGSFDIVVQDFILNCLPTIFAKSLLKETRRVLKPDGLAMISFTDASCLNSSINIRDVMNRLNLAWHPHTTELKELAKTPEQFEDLASNLIGSTLAADQDGYLIFVTPPIGRFEFFQPLSNTLDLIREVGFDVLSLQRSIGRDASGLVCMRNRCLLKPA